MNTYHLDLDINKGPLHNPDMDHGGITLRQGDKNSCTLVIDLYDHGERYVEDGLDAFFVMELPDRTHYYTEQTTYSAGTVTVLVDERHAASVHGDTVAYVELRQGDTVIASTRAIPVRILKDAREGKTPGETYDGEIAGLIDELAEAIETAETVTENVETAEAGRVTAETARATAETSRASAETARASAESSRASAETARATAETARDTAETARASAETARASAETARATAESSRVSAETQRAADQAQNNADQALNNQMASNSHIKLQSGEYDASTLRPTILGAREGAIYLVPTGNSADAWLEWIWDGSAFEPLGTDPGVLDPVTTSQIDSVAAEATPTPQGSSVLNLTGLAYLWGKLKAAFAAITHTHAASDITSGTLAVSQGGTGSGTAAGARTNLDAAQSDGATGTLKAAETGIGGLASSLAAVEQSTATASHAIGDHFVLGNVLRKATGAIATGESITSSNSATDTLQGQIDTLRDSVSSMRMTAYTLLSDQLLTTGYVTYNTYGGRKFSDYDLLLFFVRASGEAMYRDVRPHLTSSFVSGYGSVINTMHGSASSSASDWQVSSMSVAYASETSLKAKVSGSAAIDRLMVIGYKLA